MAWARYAASITPDQQEQAVREAAKALQEIPLEELRDRTRLAAKAAHQLAQIVGAMGVMAPPEMMSALAQQVAARLGGLGFFHELLPPNRNDLSEIAVTPDGGVWILRKGAQHFEPAGLTPALEEVWRGVEALLAPLGRGISEATPSVDAKLPRGESWSGARIKVLHPCLAPGKGFPSINIRLFEPAPVGAEKLIQWGMAPEAVIRALVDCVRREARILIVGGTATGKTTFLSGLADGIPQQARVVKIENPEEIWLNHPHVVTVEARPAPPGSSVPAYTERHGVDDALRMSPRYLIVGEIRTGDAAMALFRAQMSDHPGLSTFHAEGPEETVTRLCVVMYADLGVRMEAAKLIFAQAVDLVCQVGWLDGRRALIGVWEAGRRLKEGEVEFRPLYRAGESRMQSFNRRP